MQDMDRLGCLQPQVLTRVSEHMPEIIAYVDKIVQNGLAYASSGSVYFDTCAFRWTLALGKQAVTCMTCATGALVKGLAKPCHRPQWDSRPVWRLLARWQMAVGQDALPHWCPVSVLPSAACAWVQQALPLAPAVLGWSGDACCGVCRQQGCTYGKLKPWAVESACLAAEGETDFSTSEKRHRQDFALWKASKPGEPFWDSPWGNGRPGLPPFPPFSLHCMTHECCQPALQSFCKCTRLLMECSLAACVGC